VRKFTQRAIAYLKAEVPESNSPSLTLSAEDNPVLRSIGNELCVAYIIDEGSNYKYVQHRHLTEDCTSEDQLHSFGIRNLIEMASQRNLRVQPCNQIYAVLMGGDFEASLILLDQFWDNQFRQFVTGEYAVAIPNRDILAFCDRTSAEGIDELRQLIARGHTSGDHPISNKIYVRQQNTWQPRDE